MRSAWATRISEGNLLPLLSLFSDDLAIDLGTVNTREYVPGRGIVVSEPSTVAVNKNTGEMEAVGKIAKEIDNDNDQDLRTGGADFRRPRARCHHHRTAAVRPFCLCHVGPRRILPPRVFDPVGLHRH